MYLKSALKCDSFDVAIGIKIPFFRVLVTIEPGRSLLQFVTTNCFIGVVASLGANAQASSLKDKKLKCKIHSFLNSLNWVANLLFRQVDLLHPSGRDCCFTP